MEELIINNTGIRGIRISDQVSDGSIRKRKEKEIGHQSIRSIMQVKLRIMQVGTMKNDSFGDIIALIHSEASEAIGGMLQRRCNPEKVFATLSQITKAFQNGRTYRIRGYDGDA